MFIAAVVHIKAFSAYEYRPDVSGDVAYSIGFAIKCAFWPVDLVKEIGYGVSHVTARVTSRGEKLIGSKSPSRKSAKRNENSELKDKNLKNDKSPSSNLEMNTIQDLEKAAAGVDEESKLEEPFRGNNTKISSNANLINQPFQDTSSQLPGEVSDKS